MRVCVRVCVCVCVRTCALAPTWHVAHKTRKNAEKPGRTVGGCLPWSTHSYSKSLPALPQHRFLPCFPLCVQVVDAFRALRANGVDVVTLGQYMRPTKKHMAVADYITPDAFAVYQVLPLVPFLLTAVRARAKHPAQCAQAVPPCSTLSAQRIWCARACFGGLSGLPGSSSGAPTGRSGTRAGFEQGPTTCP